MLDINSILNGKSKKKSKNNKNSFLSVFQKQKPGKMNMDFSGLKSMTNNNDFKPASKHKQKEWEMFTPRKKSKLLRKFKDTDKDKKPDKWDCQPFNILAQDKTYWPNRLKEQNISFQNVSPRQKKILQKQLRKNPELLKKKGYDSRLIIEVDDISEEHGAYGVTRPVNRSGKIKDTVGNKHVVKSSYGITFDRLLFNKKYDPAFDKYIEGKNPSISQKEKAQISDKYEGKYKNVSRNNIGQTLSHEMQHVKQIEKESDGNFVEFIDKYNETPDHYEDDSDKAAYLQKETQQNRNKQEVKQDEDPKLNEEN